MCSYIVLTNIHFFCCADKRVKHEFCFYCYEVSRNYKSLDKVITLQDENGTRKFAHLSTWYGEIPGWHSIRNAAVVIDSIHVPVPRGWNGFGFQTGPVSDPASEISQLTFMEQVRTGGESDAETWPFAVSPKRVQCHLVWFTITYTPHRTQTVALKLSKSSTNSSQASVSHFTSISSTV